MCVVMSVILSFKKTVFYFLTFKYLIMQKKIKGDYGYSRFVIDNSYNVWHCKIGIDSSISTIPVINGVRTDLVNITRKYKTKSMLVLSYVTLEFKEHERMQKEITIFLEQHAINRVKLKYAWVHDDDVPLMDLPSIIEPLPEW